MCSRVCPKACSRVYEREHVRVSMLLVSMSEEVSECDIGRVQGGGGRGRGVRGDGMRVGVG